MTELITNLATCEECGEPMAAIESPSGLASPAFGWCWRCGAWRNWNWQEAIDGLPPVLRLISWSHGWSLISLWLSRGNIACNS